MTAQIVFSPDEDELFEQDLAKVDRHLQMLARDFRCTYYSMGGRGWPGRRMRRRRGFRTYELKLILNPNYPEDNQRHYELREQWMYDYGEVFTRMLSHRLLATYAPEELADSDTIASVAVGSLVAAFGKPRDVH